MQPPAAALARTAPPAPAFLLPDSSMEVPRHTPDVPTRYIEALETFDEQMNDRGRLPYFAGSHGRDFPFDFALGEKKRRVAPRQVVTIERAAVQDEITEPGFVFHGDEDDSACGARTLSREH